MWTSSFVTLSTFCRVQCNQLFYFWKKFVFISWYCHNKMFNLDIYRVLTIQIYVEQLFNCVIYKNICLQIVCCDILRKGSQIFCANVLCQVKWIWLEHNFCTFPLGMGLKIGRKISWSSLYVIFGQTNLEVRLGVWLLFSKSTWFF